MLLSTMKRKAVLSALVVCLVAGGATWWWLDRTGTEGAAAAVGDRTVEIPSDRAVDIPVTDHWTIHVPEGGVAAPSTLTITPVDDPVGPVGSDPLAASRLRLSSGQPAKPWTFTWRFDEPLAAERTLYLLDDSAEGGAYGVPGVPVEDSVAASRVLLADVTDDRRSGSVAVAHLSFKQWLTDVTGSITHALAGFLDQRYDAPTCEGARPDWLAEGGFLDDQNGPMRVCVGAGVVDPELAVVTVANNRAGVLLATAPVVPTSVHQTQGGENLGDLPGNLIASALGLFGVPAAAADRNWVLLPGQQIHLGFSRDALGGVEQPEITTRFTVTSMAVGLALRQVSELLDQHTVLWDYALVTSCVGHAVTRDWDTDGVTGLTGAFAAVVHCALEQPETIVEQARTAMPAQAWQKVSASFYRVANVAKKALARFVLLVGVPLTVLDVAETLSLPAAAYTIVLVVESSRVAGATKVVTVVAATATGGPASGYTVERNSSPLDGCSGSRAATGNDIVSCGSTAAGADICWVGGDRLTLYCGSTPWEKVLQQWSSSAPVARTAPDPDALPWGLELADGSRCRLRNGGSWPGRADGLAGAYHCGSQSVFVLTDRNSPVVDRSRPQWTVLTGGLDANNSVFPPPVPTAIITAYFAGSE